MSFIAPGWRACRGIRLRHRQIRKLLPDHRIGAQRWSRPVLAIAAMALLATTTACSGGAAGPAADSRSYASEDEIMADSVAVIHMKITGTGGTQVIDTVDHDLYRARVLASRPADFPRTITVATIPD